METRFWHTPTVSTPEITLALIFEQLTLQYQQQSSGLRPELTVQKLSSGPQQVNVSQAVNSGDVVTSIEEVRSEEKCREAIHPLYSIEADLNWMSLISHFFHVSVDKFTLHVSLQALYLQTGPQVCEQKLHFHGSIWYFPLYTDGLC